MGQNIFYLFFILSVIVFLFKRKNGIVWIPIFYVVLDSSFSFFPSLSIVTYIRPIVFLFISLFLIEKIKFNWLNRYLFIFLIYTLVLVLFSSEIFYSFKGYSQVFISMMCFPLGYLYFDSTDKLRILNRSLFYVILYSVFSSAIGYLFGIGRNFDYDSISDPESIGLLGSGGLYSAALAIGLIPMLLTTVTRPFWKWVLYISSFAAYVFILLNVRRTAILIPIVGLLTYAWFAPRKSRIFMGVVFIGFLLILSSPLYLDKLISRYNVRAEKGRFDEDFYKTENRYEENIYLISTVFSFDDPLTSLVGNKIYSSGRTDDVLTRMYHSDSANLLAGTGIIGVFLYIMVYIAFFRFPRFCKNSNNQKIGLYKTTYYSLLLMSLFVAMNGSLMLVSLRSIIFLYMGAMLSLMYREKQIVYLN